MIEHNAIKSKKKVLIVASVASMVSCFNMDNIKILQELGYEVHVACNFRDMGTWNRLGMREFKNKLAALGVTWFQVDFSRNILLCNRHVKSFVQLKDILHQYRYRFIHCHTPIGGVVGRLAAHFTNTKVIYTAHGFHFYKGAPLINWLLYYPIELFLSRYTDMLITINQEDYKIAKRFPSKKVVFIPGVGVDLEKFNLDFEIEQRESLRKQFDISNDQMVLLSVGELSVRKNHKFVIEALHKMKLKNVKYLICGMGTLEPSLKRLVSTLGMNKQVIFLGLRTDMDIIYKVADVFLFPSLQEGLSVALMEAMACGLPVLCSNIRGNVDLIKDGKGGFLFPLNSSRIFLQKLTEMIKDKEMRARMSKYNCYKIKKYDLQLISKKMKDIYINS